MYKSILIPTDGSELAAKALRDGISLSKAIGAKITVLTITLPFRIFTTDPRSIEDTRPQYKRMKGHAAKILEATVNAAKVSGVAYDTVHIEHEHPYQAIRYCHLERLRSHRHGLSRPARRLSNARRKRDAEGAYALQDSGPCPSLMASSWAMRLRLGHPSQPCEAGALH